MSQPEEQPNTAPDGCPAPGRRYPNRAKTRPRQARSRDTCPERRRLADPEHEAFVEWFVQYWRRHGAELFAVQITSEEA
jgi:hypothetical protein